jgi:hypothetical protein
MAIVKVVVFNHNQKDTAEKLYADLKPVFDVSLFDSGSAPEHVSNLTTHSFENLYWTGCWNKAWELFGDSDVIWGIGGDCQLKSPPPRYKSAIESIYPFGTWSPAVQGIAHAYMQPDTAAGNIFSVAHLEGMAFAISRDLWQQVGPLDSENYIGYGNDLLCCFYARRSNLKNILDGRVELFHPPSSQYDQLVARNLMNDSMKRRFGDDWNDVIDWWWGRQISFKSNSVSRIELDGGSREFIRPFIQR